VSDPDEQTTDPDFGYSRFDGRPLHTESDREADGIRAVLHGAGFREFAVTPDGQRYSIATTNADTATAFSDIARFKEAMTSVGYTVTPGGDDAQVVMAWPTAQALAGAEVPFSDWGGWRLNPQELTLEHESVEFWVELADCVDSAGTLDWIAHALYAHGVNDAILAGLVRALDDVLELQAALCPQGESKVLTAEHIAARIAKVAENAPGTHLA
jgi:hypothetical protein